MDEVILIGEGGVLLGEYSDTDEVEWEEVGLALE